MTEFGNLVGDLIEAEQGNGAYRAARDPRLSQLEEVVYRLRVLCGLAYRRIEELERRLEEAEEEEGRDES